MNRIKQKVDVAYTDTDSIIIQKKDLNKIKEIIHPNKIGYLKIEYECVYISPTVKIRSDYKKKENEYINKIKGINRNKIYLTNKKITNIYLNKIKNKNKNNILISNEYTELKKSIKTLDIEVKQKTIKLKLEYNKRIKIFDKKGI